MAIRVMPSRQPSTNQKKSNCTSGEDPAGHTTIMQLCAYFDQCWRVPSPPWFRPLAESGGAPSKEQEAELWLVMLTELRRQEQEPEPCWVQR